MENFLWQKTLLDLYHTFDRIVIIMDNKFNRLVTNSLYNNNNTLLYGEMLNFMARKNNCITAKLIVDEALKILINSNNNILNLYYKEKLTFRDIAKKEGVNLRKIFRNYDNEIAKFSYLLSKKGYDSKIIKQEFEGDNLFMSAYYKLKAKAEGKTRLTFHIPEVYVDENNKNADTDTRFIKDNYAGINVYVD